MKFAWFFPLVLFAMSGCSSKVQFAPTAVLPMADNLFISPVDITDPKELFELSSEQQVQLNQTLSNKPKFMSVQRWLAKQLSVAEGGFTYKDRYTQLPHDSFDERLGNCMSLTLVAAAMAEKMGLAVTFQKVEVPPVWDLDSNYLIINDHINLKVHKKHQSNVIETSKKQVTIDFMPERTLTALKVQSISKDYVIAMYYNNMAVESLIDGNIDQSYWLVKKALEHKHDYEVAINTLALVYRRAQRDDLAEQTYLYGLGLNAETQTLVNNYAILLGSQDRLEEWAYFHKQLHKFNMNNPYYFYAQAERAYSQGNFDLAIYQYNQALTKAKYRYEFHLGLAKSYRQLKQMTKAQLHYQKAEQLLPDGVDISAKRSWIMASR
ncbi:tetratricopeptide repeat protein [Paraferrimonas sp. SM1919]|uniref:tetratricopeptide repeat protein n=1 Tax=Paraferrimonas sp. SM1919 TaxID=2662263 RepID=UPI0013D55700|nr:hypothetical protein [Paraferrimonas sp. SM1919]